MISRSDVVCCPSCGNELDFDEVDVGVGVIRGDYHCNECHWSDRVEEDLREKYSCFYYKLPATEMCANCLSFSVDIKNPMGMKFGDERRESRRQYPCLRED